MATSLVFMDDRERREWLLRRIEMESYTCAIGEATKPRNALRAGSACS
jgi:hypothetical protein